MFFPQDMTFQYFFFDTYVGYFFQVLPISLLAGSLPGFSVSEKEKGFLWRRKFFLACLVCYLTGLICLVAGLRFVQVFWYTLLYRAPSGIEISFFLRWFFPGTQFR